MPSSYAYFHASQRHVADPGATVGVTMSNSVLATRYQMAGQNGTVTSISVFAASPVLAYNLSSARFRVAVIPQSSFTLLR
jgi:hypothetical protein